MILNCVCIEPAMSAKPTPKVIVSLSVSCVEERSSGREKIDDRNADDSLSIFTQK